MEVTINQEQQLFVIRNSDGFTCRGFKSLFNELRQLSSKLGITDPRASEEKIGTLEQYSAYREAISAAAKRGGFKETWFNAETPQKVRKVLEEVRKSNEVVRIYQGDPETGRDWCSEFDVIGRVSRSIGLMKIPLLVIEGDIGGAPILDACILKIQRVPDGKVLYQHERYQAPDLEIRAKRSTHRGKRYTHEVWRAKELMARFTSNAKAAHYVAFMHGYSFQQPS